MQKKSANSCFEMLSIINPPCPLIQWSRSLHCGCYFAVLGAAPVVDNASMEPQFALRMLPIIMPYVTVVIQASMGPQFALRMLPKRRSIVRISSMLQWGRSLHCGCYLRLRPINPGTLRFNGAAVCTADVTARGRHHINNLGASMGPQFALRMLRNRQDAFLDVFKLQWGRSLHCGCYRPRPGNSASSRGFNGAAVCTADVTRRLHRNHLL